MIRFVSRHVNPVVATGWHMIFGGLPLLIGSGILESDSWVNITSSGWIGLGYSTIFGSAIAYELFFLFRSHKQFNQSQRSHLSHSRICYFVWQSLPLGETLLLAVVGSQFVSGEYLSYQSTGDNWLLVARRFPLPWERCLVVVRLSLQLEWCYL